MSQRRALSLDAISSLKKLEDKPINITLSLDSLGPYNDTYREIKDILYMLDFNFTTGTYTDVTYQTLYELDRLKGHTVPKGMQVSRYKIIWPIIMEAVFKGDERIAIVKGGADLSNEQKDELVRKMMKKIREEPLLYPQFSYAKYLLSKDDV
jgi:hypothetical protein